MQHWELKSMNSLASFFTFYLWLSAQTSVNRAAWCLAYASVTVTTTALTFSDIIGEVHITHNPLTNPD